MLLPFSYGTSRRVLIWSVVIDIQMCKLPLWPLQSVGGEFMLMISTFPGPVKQTPSPWNLCGNVFALLPWYFDQT